MRNFITTILAIAPMIVSGQYPINEHFTDAAIGGWTQTLGTTGDTGFETPTTLCFNITGNYVDKDYYSFESPVLDHTACDSIKVDFSVIYNKRNGDDCRFCYNDGGWGCISIPSSGAWTVDLPASTTQIAFDLDASGNGNRNGKFFHIDYANIAECYVTPLPITLLDFNCANGLYWATAEEINSDFFTIQYSSNGDSWEDVLTVSSKGSHSEYYSKFDRAGYYRLKQTDVDGSEQTHSTVYCNLNQESNVELIKIFNHLGQEVNVDFKGLRIHLYSDGSTKKLIKIK